MFTTETIDQLAKQLKEPVWMTELRRKALARHAELPWPHPSDDVWRRFDVSLLDPSKGFAPVPPALLDKITLSNSQFAALTKPLGNEQMCVRINGSWLTDEKPRGFIIEDGIDPDPIRHAIERDGFTPPPLQEAAAVKPWRNGESRAKRETEETQPVKVGGFTDAEQKLSSLNQAFHHDDVAIQVPANVSVPQPLRLVHIVSAGAKQALFPLTVITVGAGSTVTIIDEYVSVEPSGCQEPHLINGRIELVIEPDASVQYVRLQRWGAHAREFLLQRATLSRGATLTMANINLGASLSKAHLVTRLAGERASAKLCGFVFGRDAQHIDQHTLQDHQAPRTTSDLQVNAALQDRSRMTYTGLIRIAKEAVQTSAYQSNHNLMLSQAARAETIPMLEILADDVQCKHGASIGPIDEEQAFYLMSRGISREQAQRLLVMGFVETVIQRLPFEPLQERLRQEIEEGIHS